MCQVYVSSNVYVMFMYSKWYKMDNKDPDYSSNVLIEEKVVIQLQSSNAHS